MVKSAEALYREAESYTYACCALEVAIVRRPVSMILAVSWLYSWTKTTQNFVLCDGSKNKISAQQAQQKQKATYAQSCLPLFRIRSGINAYSATASPLNMFCDSWAYVVRRSVSSLVKGCTRL